MGNESVCKVRLGERLSQGKALLETKELIFRGDFRLSIPLATVKSVRASHGVLTVEFEGGRAIFELGPLAEKWEQKIKNPKGRLEKLGVKEGMKVALIGISDESFRTELTQRVGSVVEKPSKGQFDLVFYGAGDRADLGRLERLVPRLTRAGALWVVRPKGCKAITEAEVMAAGKAAGLVDTKVVAFSDTHTAEKFVIPVAKR